MKRIMSWVLTCVFMLTAVFTVTPTEVKAAGGTGKVHFNLNGKVTQNMYINYYKEYGSAFIEHEHMDLLGFTETIGEDYAEYTRDGKTICFHKDLLALADTNGYLLDGAFPFESGGGYYIPLTAICEFMDWDHSMNNATNTYSMNTAKKAPGWTAIDFYINDEQKIDFGGLPTYRADSAYVVTPMRPLAEALGGTVTVTGDTVKVEASEWQIEAYSGTFTNKSFTVRYEDETTDEMILAAFIYNGEPYGQPEQILRALGATIELGGEDPASYYQRILPNGVGAEKVMQRYNEEEGRITPTPAPNQTSGSVLDEISNIIRGEIISSVTHDDLDVTQERFDLTDSELLDYVKKYRGYGWNGDTGNGISGGEDLDHLQNRLGLTDSELLNAIKEYETSGQGK